MSTQHEELKYVGSTTEESTTEESSADESGADESSAGDQPEKVEAPAGAEPLAGAGESAGAGQSAEAGQSEEEQESTSTPGDQSRMGWSGRAVGPLSGLLPGAVELTSDELPQLSKGVDETEAPEAGLSATDDRWHEVLARFVDDPRGAVEAARSLIDRDIAAHIALLTRRREAMRAAWHASKDLDTERLRVTLVNYRDLRKRLADGVNALRDHGSAGDAP